jgi:DNA modification methylase
MYLVRGDRVLDPFLGTGTTIFAAMASCRHSVGVEVDHRFKELIYSRLGTLKHHNVHYGFPVMTRQESATLMHFI